MDQADDNSLTAPLTKRAQVRWWRCRARTRDFHVVTMSYVKCCVNMWTVCAQLDGSMSSLLQSTGSSPYVLVHIVGPLAATLLLWLENLSGICANLRTVAASNNRDHARNLSYCCLLALQIWWCYSSRTSRSWWITQSTQHHQRGCNTTSWAQNLQFAVCMAQDIFCSTF